MYTAACRVIGCLESFLSDVRSVLEFVPSSLEELDFFVHIELFLFRNLPMTSRLEAITVSHLVLSCPVSGPHPDGTMFNTSPAPGVRALAELQPD